MIVCHYNTKMLFHRAALILALSVLIQLAVGCERAPVTEANNAATNRANSNRAIEPGMEGAKDNADELGTLIKLPYEPEDLVWKDFAAESGQSRRLLAVIQLTPDETRKLIDSASKTGTGKPTSISSEKWFPKELVTQSEMSSDEGIQATSYPANDLLQPPFTQGTLSHVNNTDFFVIELFAK